MMNATPIGFSTATSTLLMLLLAAATYADAAMPSNPSSAIPADWAQSSRLTDGGIAAKSIVDISDDSVPFDRAARVEITERADAIWSVQLDTYNHVPVKRGDVLHVGFWARCAESMTGEGYAQIKYELNSDPWPYSMSMQISYAGEWKRFDLPFKAERDYAVGEAKLTLLLGFDKQIAEFGGMTAVNYGPDYDVSALARTEVTYAGREPDATWRAEATQRIDKLRKGDIAINVADAEGKPVQGAAVEAVMTRHAFSFGTAVVAEALADDNDSSPYKKIVEGWFNEVVFENDLKWVNHGTGDPEHISKALSWLGARDIAVRGHVLVWPSWSYTPTELKAMADQPELLKDTVAQRVATTAAKYRGHIQDWDVVNEPFNNHDLMDVLGKEVVNDWFRIARENAPDAKLYFNDWGILTAGGRDIKHQNIYYDYCKQVIDAGAPIDGIGMQGHFGSTLTGPTQLLKILDRFAALGTRIKVTELDIVLDNEQVRADYMRDFLTVMFSHEAVDGVLMWGFWAKRHWKPSAAIFDADWNLKPHGRAWQALVNEQWKTHETGTTDSDGVFALRGFCGEYKVTVKHNGQTTTSLATLTRDGLDLDVTME